MRVARVLSGMLGVLAVAPAAHAAEVSVGGVGNGSSGHTVYAAISLRDSTGERNLISFPTSSGAVARVRDDGAGLTVGVPSTGFPGACVVGPQGHEASCAGVCPSDPTGIAVCASPFIDGVYADLGPGDDVITAPAVGSVDIVGGSGRDTISTGNAQYAFIDAQDGEADTIRCGSGYDTVLTDSRDVLVNPEACESH
jgi:hypothetical protein